MHKIDYDIEFEIFSREEYNIISFKQRIKNILSNILFISLIIFFIMFKIYLISDYYKNNSRK